MTRVCEPALETATVEGSATTIGAVEGTPLERLLARGRLRATLTMLGPAFVAAVAYVDPGNFATNVQAGAKFGYGLLWVVMLANLMAMLIQYLSAKLGVASGRSLPELCRERFPRWTSWALWVQAEVMAMATDVAEFLGAAIGLNLIFGVPLLVAGFITGVIAFGLLELQRRGYRSFEVAIAALLGIVFAGFLYETLKIGPSASASLRGLIPSLGGSSELYLAVGIVGATVMPHVIYLHSALTKGRMPARDDAERRRVLRFERLDVMIALALAGLINLAMLAAFAKLFHVSGPVRAEHDRGGSPRDRASGRRRRRLGLRGRAAGVGGVVLERRHLRRTAGHGGVYRRPPACLSAPGGDHASRPDHPRARGQPDQRTDPQPGRALLRNPVCGHPPGHAHRPPGCDGRPRRTGA